MSVRLLGIIDRNLTKGNTMNGIPTSEWNDILASWEPTRLFFIFRLALSYKEGPKQTTTFLSFTYVQNSGLEGISFQES